MNLLNLKAAIINYQFKVLPSQYCIPTAATHGCLDKTKTREAHTILWQLPTIFHRDDLLHSSAVAEGQEYSSDTLSCQISGDTTASDM